MIPTAMNFDSDIRQNSMWARIDGVIAMVIAAIATWMTYWATVDGNSSTPDSAQYLSVADNLARGNGFVLWNGTELTAFPPGYPLLIRLGMTLGITADTSARLIGVVSVGLVVLLAGLLARLVTSRAIMSIVALITALVPAVTYTATWIYAESIFTVALLVTVIGLVRFIGSADAGRPWFALMVLGTWACCGVRYSGYAVLAGCTLALVISREAGRQRWVRSIRYLGWALVMPLVIVVHNLWRDGTAGRPGFGPRHSLWSDLVDVSRAVGRWTWRRPDWLDAVTDGQLGLMVMVALVGLLVAGLRSKGKIGGRSEVMALLIVIALFLVFTLVSARRVWVSVDQRVLLPVVPLLIVTTAWAIVAHSRPTASTVRLWTRVSSLLLAAFLGSRYVEMVTFAREYPQVYGDRAWLTSPSIGRIRTMSSQRDVYTNDPEGVWIRTRRDGIRDLEELRRMEGESAVAHRRRLDRVSCGTPLIAWFERSGRIESEFLDDLARTVPFVVVIDAEGRAGFLEPAPTNRCV